MPANKSLAVVMPVFNEEGCIAEIIVEWLNTLNGLDIDFGIFVLDDGSTDGTPAKLQQFKANEKVKIVRLTNGGHGPAIMRGYFLAVDYAEWVFQTDSDGEMESCHFAELWKRRRDYDALMGIRTARGQAKMRAGISFVSRICVRWLYAPGVIDVNVPYRLMRAELLAPILKRISPDSFAPNVMISGILGLKEARILNYPVPFASRKAGLTSLNRWKLLKGACKSFMQLAKLRLIISNKTLITK
jgi:dolichol-phosphate mannosyltransferase